MKTEYDYVVSLQRPGFKKYDFISVLLLAIAFLIFLFFAFLYHPRRWIYIAASVIIFLQLAYNFYQRKNNEIVTHKISFFVCFLAFLVLPSQTFLQFVIALLYGFAGFIEKYVKFPEEIGFDEEGITINTFIRRHYEWDLLNNVILKDGLLTIDYKNNKLFQKEVEEKVSPALEKEFNEFCRLQLQSASDKAKFAMN